MEEKEAVLKGFPTIPRSDSKIVGEKRSGDELEKRQDFSHKRLQLDSVLESEITEHDWKTIGNKESYENPKFTGEDMSQLTDVSHILDTQASEAKNKDKMTDLDAKISLRELDLNTDVCLANDSVLNGTKTQSSPKTHDSNLVPQKGIGLDLNADAVSSSVKDDSFCGLKKHSSRLKPRDVFSECGSSNGPSEGKDPMKVWAEMKQNGFLSCPHGGISATSTCVVTSSHGGIPAPRKRGRKNKNDMMKKKMEIAKREEVDRFTKIAAPSGLLNDLNPGIINHVRNKKQVLSIIQNLIKSEKDSRSNPGTQTKVPDDANYKGIGQSGFSHEDWSLSDCNQKFKFSSLVDKCGNCESSLVDMIKLEEDSLSLKLSSLSNDESADFRSTSVLTVKAATVASQWLELLHQDVKGRLSALRRSKKRVRAVITTELPFLMLKEFPSDQENHSHAMNDGFSKPVMAETHKARWIALFDQLDQTLSEEENQLEGWLNQVRELRTHCDQGLQHLSWDSSHNLLQLGIPEAGLRAKEAVSSEKEIAVRAAAASIYSTCSFLLSKENLTCS